AGEGVSPWAGAPSANQNMDTATDIPPLQGVNQRSAGEGVSPWAGAPSAKKEAPEGPQTTTTLLSCLSEKIFYMRVGGAVFMRQRGKSPTTFIHYQLSDPAL
ncbi:MAG: hypothetical protein KDD55_12045, partial [Bdellovibrionales bacterium]|nr:hypothetical protein [Bdellovibrionales bacterium]